MFFTFKNYVSMKDKKYCISHRPENWSEKFGERRRRLCKKPFLDHVNQDFVQFQFQTLATQRSITKNVFTCQKKGYTG